MGLDKRSAKGYVGAMIFHTVSGSVYEVDQENKQVRRLVGKNDPTPRQGKDGDWRKYSFASDVVVGESVVFLWGDDTELLPETIASGESAVPTTMTSMVEKIVDENKLS